MTTSRATETLDLTRLVGLKLGNYRLERLIGRGRMGVVYLANDEALLRPTAIKLLSWRAADAQGQDPVRWFLGEARMVARINHPRVVQIYGAARQGEHCYIAMEYVVGRSAEAIVGEGPVAPEMATDIFLQAAAALHAAHGSGIIHRDVKPANLLVGAGGVTKLGDFGMALGTAELSVGNAHVRVGTPYYTAPEIWAGGKASASSDIYSLGATYFHLLTGRPPYPGTSIAAVEQAHLRAPIPDPRELVPGLPASCAALLARALSKDPRDRHESALVLLWEGRRVMQDLVAAAGTPPPVARHLEHAFAPVPPPEPRPPPPPAPEALRSGLGFIHRPFVDVAPPEATVDAPSLAALRGSVLALMADDQDFAAALTGAPSSGHAALGRRIAAELARERLVLSIDLTREAAGQTLLQRVCRAAGAAEEPTEEASLDALVERMGEERKRRRLPPALVLEGVDLQRPAAAGLVRIIGAARWSRAFKVLLIGAPGLAEALDRAGLDAATGRVPELYVSPLGREEIGAYVRGWIDATLAPRSPPIVLSRDALLLLALRTDGALERINCLAENMLLLAAAEGRRALCTWHAWAASDQERWAGVRAPAALPHRPEPWPPAEVADVIDACRRGAGMPPWPRIAGRSG